MITQRNNFFWYKLNGLLRSFIVRGGCRICFDHITVNEYPKSGGTWIGQMLSEATGLPFPRNRLPLFSDSIMHGHYLSSFGMKNVIVVWRDGRDVVVSQYYHWLFGTEIGANSLVQSYRNDLQFDDYDDIVRNLPKFIEYVNVQKTHPSFSWSEFVNHWLKADAIFVKYEDMRSDPVAELRRIINKLTGKTLSENRIGEIVEKYSFESKSGRKCGQEKKGSFMRKGIVGDWKNCFSEKSIKTFKQYAGNELVKLGYERDLNW
jgi:hypothetical protein